jgi:hypothetical protein
VIPLIPALGIVAFSTFSGAAAGHTYGKNPSTQRDSVVERVDEWVGILDRVGPFPIEIGARFAVGLAADFCFGDSISPNLTAEGLQEFTNMCRKAGITERAMRKLIQKAFHNNRNNAVLLSALRGIL